jgi:hypothetical protein
MSNFDASRQNEQTLLISLCRGLKRVFDKYHVNILYSVREDKLAEAKTMNDASPAVEDYLKNEAELYFFFGKHKLLHQSRTIQNYTEVLVHAISSPKNFSSMDLTASKAWLDVVLVFIFKVSHLKF